MTEKCLQYKMPQIAFEFLMHRTAGCREPCRLPRMFFFFGFVSIDFYRFTIYTNSSSSHVILFRHIKRLAYWREGRAANCFPSLGVISSLGGQPKISFHPYVLLVWLFLYVVSPTRK